MTPPAFKIIPEARGRCNAIPSSHIAFKTVSHSTIESFVLIFITLKNKQSNCILYEQKCKACALIFLFLTLKTLIFIARYS